MQLIQPNFWNFLRRHLPKWNIQKLTLHFFDAFLKALYAAMSKSIIIFSGNWSSILSFKIANKFS